MNTKSISFLLLLSLLVVSGCRGTGNAAVSADAGTAVSCDRTSALIPASFHRFLSQMAAASEGGVERIVSFMMCGIYEDPSSPYKLGQPHWSSQAWSDYMDWLDGGRRWIAAGNAFLGLYGPVAAEDPADTRWKHYAPGTCETVVELPEDECLESLMVRMLSSRKDNILPPERLAVYTSEDGVDYDLLRVVETPFFPNDRHDAYVCSVLVDDVEVNEKSRFHKVSYTSENRTALDRIIVNP